MFGRVILRRDYPRTLELAETCTAPDPNTEFAAIRTVGPENVAVLAVATAPWSAPCRALQTLLTLLQNNGHGLVILDFDVVEDAKLIKQLEINSFPTLTCVVGGRKKAELVGVFTQSEFYTFVQQMHDFVQELGEG